MHLTHSTARSITDLQQQACLDRIELAKNFLIAGDKLMKARPALYRSAVSRYYYAMYHAARAVAYFYHGGDDHESHSKLPKAIPGDFADSAVWQNQLKDARSRRNEADYDPYPTDTHSWRRVAKDLQVKAPSLLSLADTYLKQKGCGTP
ncbi:HEPN domain-containing protein [Streptomyces malaysiensis]|uniref:HEPN domain-containing protein n=1 Tax=Streptomyces malaysiensis TaxID=92644 RepID=UPI0033EE1A08